MSSTNKTTYYQLSQYVGTDIINPLTDFNGDNEKIDTALHQIAETAGSSATDITALAGRVTTEEGKVTALENQNGNAVLVTAAQTLSGAINELKGVNDTQNSTLSAHTSSIDNLGARMTSAESAIDNIEDTITHKTLATATADGVKTYREIMVELFGAINDKSKLEDTQLILEIPNINYKACYQYNSNQGDYGLEYFNVASDSTSNIKIITFSTQYSRECIISSSGTTVTDTSNTVAGSDFVFKIVEK